MGEVNKSYYAVIPANVRYDKRLKLLSRLLFGEISALCNERGYCWAPNKYFSELYDVSTRTVSDCINELKDLNYISVIVTYKENSKEVDKRYIKISEGELKPQEIAKRKSKVFKKPTFDEVHQYCVERKNSVDAQKFVDYYESKGWLVGKTPMKDWKAAVRTWEQNSYGKGYNNKSNETTPVYELVNAPLTREDIEATFEANGWEKW